MVSVNKDSKGIYVTTEQEHDSKYPQRVVLTYLLILLWQGRLRKHSL